jgi:hypothetical protein
MPLFAVEIDLCGSVGSSRIRVNVVSTIYWIKQPFYRTPKIGTRNTIVCDCHQLR